MSNELAIGTEVQVALDSGFESIVYDDTVSETQKPYRTSITFGEFDLPWGMGLFMRVRHLHPTMGYTPWSDTVQFSIITPPNIIGVCLNADNSFSWIDGKGRQLLAFEYSSHPVYSNISMVSSGESDGAMTLTKIPKFYVNTAETGPEGSYAEGKQCWWLSDIPATGFRAHGAFKRGEEGEEEDFTYLGTYLCSEYTFPNPLLTGQTEEDRTYTTIPVSRKNQEVAANKTKAIYDEWMSGLSDAYRIFDIWDLSLVKFLALIAKADANTQLAYGDNTEIDITTPRTGTSDCKLVFKGTNEEPLVLIDDLWKMYWYHVAGVTVENNYYRIMTPHDHDTPTYYPDDIPVGRIIPSVVSGWITDMAVGEFNLKGTMHNLQELFLPVGTSTEQGDSPYCDYYSYSNDYPNIVAGCSVQYSTVESKSYWSAFGTSCPRREYIEAIGGDTWAERLMESDNTCPNRQYHMGNGSSVTGWSCKLDDPVVEIPYTTVSPGIPMSEDEARTNEYCLNTSRCNQIADVIPPYHKCTQSEGTCTEIRCGYNVNTAVSGDWSTKAGLFSIRTNSVPSEYLALRIAKR